MAKNATARGQSCGMVKGCTELRHWGPRPAMAHGPAAATRHAARPGFFHIHIDQS